MATSTRSCPTTPGSLSRVDRRQARHRAGGGHARPCATPVKTNVMSREFADTSRRLRRRQGPGRRSVPKAAHVVPVVANRARPRAARRRDRRRVARAPPRPADRLAGPAPGDAGARGSRRARAPGEPVPGERERARRVRGRRARSARLRGDPAHGRDPGGELPRVPRRRGRRAHDLSSADEAWDIDHFLHENPELKRAAYAWLTDFVGWLPMADGGAGRRR